MQLAFEWTPSDETGISPTTTVRRPRRRAKLPVVPATRAGCLEMPRPCPAATCFYHMSPIAPSDWVLPLPSCVLDVADLVDLGHPRPELQDIAAWYGVTEGRIKQVQSRALRKMRGEFAVVGCFEEILGGPDALVRTQLGSEWSSLREIADGAGLSIPNTEASLARLLQLGAPIERRGGDAYRWGASMP